MQKTLLISVLAAALSMLAPGASANEHEAREALAHDIANMTLTILTDPKKPVEERQNVLKQGFANVVDIEWIAKFVLGKAWKNASAEQREQYTALYRTYLTQIYVATYAENPERKILDIKVLAVHDVDESHFAARTEIALSSSERIKVDYAVSGNEGHYKIIDVVVEGVSLLASHRAQFTQIASNEGVGGVIHTLERLVSTPATGLRYSMNGAQPNTSKF